ncbi:MAG TPA: ATP-binding cassette domain-containing protein [Calditrichae bacterium]|nr:ATP-binding cassette domain-containing protein [Calditrichia bacterium]
MIEFQDVTLELQGRLVLDNISFRIHQGDSVLLVGNSGAGKSTIMKLILGLIKPTAGKIRIFGEDITRLSEKKLLKIRQQFGMVFQGGALFDSLTVEDNVAYFLKENLRMTEAEIKVRVHQTLEFLGLSRFLNYFPSQLSGGMVKRVAIARAIVSKPKALLYDEPTAGLDPISARRVVELIQHLQEKFGTTSLIVSHEIHYFLETARRMLMLKGGTIMYDGEPNLDILEYFDETDGITPVHQLAG